MNVDLGNRFSAWDFERIIDEIERDLQVSFSPNRTGSTCAS
jgi:hypothetical protein